MTSEELKLIQDSQRDSEKRIHATLKETLDNFRQDAFVPMRDDVRKTRDTVVEVEKTISAHGTRLDDVEGEVSTIRGHIAKIVLTGILGGLGYVIKAVWSYMRGPV